MPPYATKLGILLVGVLGFRACLPLVVEWGIEHTGSRYLDGRVEVEDVDLGLLAGRVAVEGIRVDRAPVEGAEAAPPIATLALLAVDTAPSALLGGVLRIEELVVEGGTARLERSESGDVVLPLSEEALAAMRAPPEQPEPAPDGDLLPLPLRLDSLRIADLHARLHDAVEDVDSAAFDLTATELADLRVEGTHVTLGRVAVVEPSLLLDRGLVTGPRALLRGEEIAEAELPDVAAPPPDDVAARTAPSGEATRASDEADAVPAPQSSPIDATLTEVAIEDAGFTWVDRTLDPVVREESKRFSLVAHDLVLSDRGFSNLAIQGEALRGEPFDLTGGADEDGGLAIHFVGKQIDLTPFGPYAAEVAGYGVEQGAVSIDTRVRADLPRIETENEVVLHGLRLSGEGGVEQTLGMSANLAIALLSGPNGDFELALPVDFDLSEDAVDTAVASARESVQAALERSLEGVGELGEGGAGLRFDPLASEAGQAALAGGQEEHLNALAELLAARPAVAVVLSGRASEGDVAPLAERLDLVPTAVTAEHLRALGRERAELVGQTLAQRGVPAGQVRIGDAARPGDPGVLLQLALAAD